MAKMRGLKNIIRENFERNRPARSYKVGRNDLCPCGSGQKYKKCCDRVRPEREKEQYFRAVEDIFFDASNGPHNMKGLRIRRIIVPLEDAIDDYPLSVEFLEVLAAACLNVNENERADEILGRLWRLQGPEMRDMLLRPYCNFLFGDARWSELDEVLQECEDFRDENRFLTAYHGLSLLNVGDSARGEEMLWEALDSRELTEEKKEELLDALWGEGFKRLALEVYVQEYEGHSSILEDPPHEELERPEMEKTLCSLFSCKRANSSSLQQWGEKLLKMLEIAEENGQEAEMNAISADVNLPLACMRWLCHCDNYELMDTAGDLLKNHPDLADIAALDRKSRDEDVYEQEKKEQADVVEFYKLRALSMYMLNRREQLVHMIRDNFSFAASEFSSEPDRYEGEKCELFLLSQLAGISLDGEKEVRRQVEKMLCAGNSQPQNKQRVQRELAALRLLLRGLREVNTAISDLEMGERLKSLLHSIYAGKAENEEELPAADYDDLVAIQAYERLTSFKLWLAAEEEPHLPFQAVAAAKASEQRPDFLAGFLTFAARVEEDMLARPRGAAHRLVDLIDRLGEMKKEEWRKGLGRVFSAPAFLPEDVRARLEARLWQFTARKPEETDREEEDKLLEDVEKVLAQEGEKLDEREILFYKFVSRAAAERRPEAFAVLEKAVEVTGQSLPALPLKGSEATYFDGFFGFARFYIPKVEIEWYLLNRDMTSEELREMEPRVREELEEELLEADSERVMELLSDADSTSRLYTAIRAASQRPRDVTPHLLRVLEDTAATMEEAAKSGTAPDVSMLPIYALFLLADFGEERAFPLALEIISHREKVVDPVLGDVLTEDIPRVLLSVFNGDLQALKDVIENESIAHVSRTAALETLVLLVADGQLEREEVKDYFSYLYREGLKRKKDSFIWGILVTETKNLRLEELKSLAEMGYEEGYVNEYVFPRDELLEGIDCDDKDEKLAQLYDREGIFERYLPISDAAEVAGRWL
ncbi:DUF1186 domain-containing protein [Halarsenatibacter silvermanii]|uniref:SEC-C motif-containing protein n=1 Tax=Halarsenatibacter silvermanii TaxID=321763 RepID=A0A1G9TPI6_9FIRM|nr:DUF1186 domain-containing protein [Halarsenatibacter silvermanii]SDM49571.1 SEC-C motif-containing protein [Halarsenatibacter silvermanii]